MKNIILTGNPNTGKTTLFNLLTNSQMRAGNWHGLTVEPITKPIKLKSNKIHLDNDYTITDLPGIYSLEGNSFEEKLAINYLSSHKDDLIVNVCDSINLKKNLNLSKQLVSTFKNVVILVNEFSEYPIQIDTKNIERNYNIKILKCNFQNKKSVLNTFFDIFAINFTNFDNILRFFDNIDNFISSNNTNLRLNILEKIFISKWTFPFGFLASLFLIFFLTFGPIGDFLSNFLSNIFVTKIGKKLLEFMSTAGSNFWLIDLVENGVLVAFDSIFSFLPQMLLLLMCFNFFEDMGLFSYLAYNLDGLLKKVGLSGKSVFSLILSYGCNTSAVTTTRNLSTLNIRKKTVLLIPYFSCSAEIPLILCLTSLLFDKYKYFIMLGIYLLGAIISLIIAWVITYHETTKHALNKPSCCSNELKNYNLESENLIMEMPRMRFPKLKKIFLDSYSNLKDFASKFCTLLLFCSVLLWFLMSFSFKLEFVGSGSEKSIFIFICNIIKPIFIPIGIASTACIAGILASIIAKELALPIMLTAVSLETSNALNIFQSFTNPVASAISYLVFMFLFVPCIACMFNISRELGKKYALIVGATSSIVAYLISFITYHSIMNKNFFLIFSIILILLAIIYFLVLKYLNKSCNNCNKTCNIKRIHKVN